jgi:hypothetical protein
VTRRAAYLFAEGGREEHGLALLGGEPHNLGHLQNNEL